MTAEPTPTVRSRVLAAGVTEENLAATFERGAVLLGGEPVTDLDTPAPPGARIYFGGQ